MSKINIKYKWKEKFNLNYKQQSTILGIISSLILTCVVIALGYSATRSYNRSTNQSFNLSANSITFKLNSDVKVNSSDIINPTTNDSITILSEYINEEYLGLYDPRFYFYRQKMVISHGETRYFSQSDYINKTKTAIFVSDIDLFQALSMLPSIKTPLIEECIFHINSMSSLYRDNINYIINQTRLEYLGDIVYLDSEDSNLLNIYKDKLLSHGYDLVIRNQDARGLSKLLYDSIPRTLYEIVVLTAALSMYPLFLFCCIIYFYNKNKTLEIHKLHGGRTSPIFFELIKPFLISNICISSILFFFVYSFYFKYLFSYYSFFSFIFILISHLAITSLFFYIGFYLNIKTVDIFGGNKNVR